MFVSNDSFQKSRHEGANSWICIQEGIAPFCGPQVDFKCTSRLQASMSPNDMMKKCQITCRSAFLQSATPGPQTLPKHPSHQGWAVQSYLYLRWMLLLGPKNTFCNVWDDFDWYHQMICSSLNYLMSNINSRYYIESHNKHFITAMIEYQEEKWKRGAGQVWCPIIHNVSELNIMMLEVTYSKKDATTNN